MSGRLLLIENDHNLKTSLTTHLAHQGWQVNSVSSLSEAWKMLDTHQFELAIVDRILDDGDGLDLIAYLREIQHPMMTICLTSRSQVMERLEGLKKGADDYLPKPFSSQELVLRIKNLLHKHKTYQRSHLVCDAMRLDAHTGYLTTPSQTYRLRRRESQILSCLFRHQNSVVTRQMLIDTLWPGATTIPQEGTLDVYIRRLRMELGEYGQKIKTVRGFGYMLKP